MSQSVIYNKMFSSDIFLVDNQFTFYKPTKKNVLRISSDIFNIKHSPKKPHRIRNYSQSDIFFTEGKDFFIDNETKSEYKSNYDPNKYSNLNASYDMKSKVIIDTKLNESAQNIKNKKINMKFIQLANNKTEQKIIKNKNRSFEFEERNLPSISKPREAYYKNLSSHIFNDDDGLEKKNLVIKPRKIPKENHCSYMFTQPKTLKDRNKWIANLNWKDPKGEILFKNFNERNSRVKTAFERKINDMNDTALDYSEMHKNTSNSLSMRKGVNINNYKKPDIPSNTKNVSRQKKIIEGTSNLNYPDNFYEESYKLNYTGDIQEMNYELCNTGNLTKGELQKFFNKKGVHIYNIHENNDNIFNRGENSITFSLREHKDNQKKGGIDIKELKSKYKMIDIKQKKNVSVNKKIHAEIYEGNKVIFKYNNVNNGWYLPITTRRNNDIDRTFTNRYKNINREYKSKGFKK